MSRSASNLFDAHPSDDSTRAERMHRDDRHEPRKRRGTAERFREQQGADYLFRSRQLAAGAPLPPLKHEPRQ